MRQEVSTAVGFGIDRPEMPSSAIAAGSSVVPLLPKFSDTSSRTSSIVTRTFEPVTRGKATRTAVVAFSAC